MIHLISFCLARCFDLILFASSAMWRCKLTFFRWVHWNDISKNIIINSQPASQPSRACLVFGSGLVISINIYICICISTRTIRYGMMYVQKILLHWSNLRKTKLWVNAWKIFEQVMLKSEFYSHRALFLVPLYMNTLMKYIIEKDMRRRRILAKQRLTKSFK